MTEKMVQEVQSFVHQCFPETLSYEESHSVYRMICDAARAELQKRTATIQQPSHITSNLVRLECRDDASGILVNRELPLDFEENHLALRLIGEDFQGKPSEIVFLSELTQQKVPDVMGRGPDHDTCHD